MRGPEMMIASLLGLKPEEMQVKVKEAIELMETGARAMASIQSDLTKIKIHLGIEQEGIVNGGTAIANRRNSPDNNHIQL